MSSVAVRAVASIAAVVVLGAACGSTSDRSTISAQQIELTEQNISYQRSVWEREGPDDYAYTIHRECSRLCEVDGNVRVTVIDGEVVDVVSLIPTIDPYRVYYTQTIDGIFDSLAGTLFDEFKDSGGGASALFSRRYGYPTEFVTRWAPGSEMASTISGFTVNPEPPAQSGLEELGITVSNQSFDVPDIDMTVTVDGTVVADSTYPVANQHHVVNYAIELMAGMHTIVVTTADGATAEVEFTMPENAPYYASVSYWNDDELGERIDIAVNDAGFSVA